MGCGAGSPAPCPELTSGYSFHRYTGTYPIEKQLDVCKALFFLNTLLIENKTKKNEQYPDGISWIHPCGINIFEETTSLCKHVSLTKITYCKFGNFREGFIFAKWRNHSVGYL